MENQIPQGQINGPMSLASALEHITEHTEKKLQVFWPNLDTRHFDRKDSYERLGLLCTRGGQAYARFLVSSVVTGAAVVKSHPRLVSLCRKFPSYIQFRQLPKDYSHNEEVFITGDDRNYLHLPRLGESLGYYELDNRQRTKHLLNRFDGFWQRSALLPEIHTAGL